MEAKVKKERCASHDPIQAGIKYEKSIVHSVEGPRGASVHEPPLKPLMQAHQATRHITGNSAQIYEAREQLEVERATNATDSGSLVCALIVSMKRPIWWIHGNIYFDLVDANIAFRSRRQLQSTVAVCKI